MSPNKRVAVFVPDECTPYLSTLDALLRQTPIVDGSVPIVFGCRQPKAWIPWIRRYQGDFECRPVTWLPVSHHELSVMQRYTDHQPELQNHVPHYCCPSDGMGDFMDCASWLLLPRSFSSVVAPCRSYLLFADAMTRIRQMDYAERLVLIATMRQAHAVIAASEAECDRIRHFSGVTMANVWSLQDSLSSFLNRSFSISTNNQVIRV